MSRISVLLIAIGLTLSAMVAPASADEGEPTYVLTGPDYVAIGAIARVELTATGEDGLPMIGLRVRFTRTGPEGESAASCATDDLSQCSKTFEHGQSYYYVSAGLVEGITEVRAEVYGPDGTLLGEAGPLSITIYASCSFPVAKCSPPPSPWLTGTHLHGRDVLKVRSYTWRPGSKVALLRKAAGEWTVASRVETLGKSGRCVFSVKDSNGHGRTRYRAALLFPDPTYGGGTTNTLNLR